MAGRTLSPFVPTKGRASSRWATEPWLPPLLKRWLLAFVGGEILGFGLAAPIVLLGVARTDAMSGPSKLAAVLLAGLGAGVVEGGAVGWLQWRAVRDPLPAIGRERWIAATIAGAVLAWVIGISLGAFAAPDSEPSLGIVVVGAAGLGLALGGILGIGQWFVLRGHVRGAVRWILANALGWSIGMVVAFAGAGLATEETPVGVVVLLAASTGAVMALVPALTTGRVLLAFASERGEGPVGTTGDKAATRLRRLNRWNRRINPFVIRLLRSPLHRLASGRLLLITIPIGHGGATASLPVGYAVAGGDLFVASYRNRRWWRKLPTPVTILLRGTERSATGEVVTEEGAVAALLREVPGLFGRRVLSPAAAAERAQAMVVVRFRVVEE